MTPAPAATVTLLNLAAGFATEPLDDAQLETLLYPPPPAVATERRPAPDWAVVHRELRRPNVTLALLWEEYRTGPGAQDGFGYSWFCDLYREWVGRLAGNASMKGTMVAGAVRNGSALLVGLLRCGRCGRKFKVLHHSRRDARYVCASHVDPSSEKGCSAFSNMRIDVAVSGEVLRAISPLGGGVEADR